MNEARGYSDLLKWKIGRGKVVNNTDAEGRFTLADALVYACNQVVDKLLTGTDNPSSKRNFTLIIPVQRLLLA
ncbi:hypothetical protein L1987_30334 [Smallanthus sonchifolius]|uniref:Uncharacterized protein n=1 Tax=Smallanthus sonchifolius TaxID=185202 RepID=A0ACB9I2I5_9ASTR|nr:hypothetical protein L1987_30334 [Smallanthus sonchifolius]